MAGTNNPGNTGINIEEFKRLVGDVARRYDRNGDGNLDRGDRNAIYMAFSPAINPELLGQRVEDALARQGLDVLSISSVVNGIGAFMQAYDMDRNGSLSSSELQPIVQGAGRIARELQR